MSREMPLDSYLYARPIIWVGRVIVNFTRIWADAIIVIQAIAFYDTW